MHITFEKIKFKNFLSFGDSFTEIDLSTFNSTLITGSNFSGKSGSLLDTINFALFGRAFRNINKPQLVNVYNKKDCLVELEFKKNDVKYLIRRGIKPNLFEIYKDGKIFDILSSTKDQQQEFEKNVLNFSFQTFQQIVVLGSANYIPFMKLKPADRRLVVDDILNLQVFTKMNEKLKDEISETKTHITSIKNEIYIKQEILKNKKEYLKDLFLMENNQDQINKIKELENENVELKTQIENKELEYQSIEVQELIELHELEMKINEFEKIKSKIMYAVENQKSVYDFFTEHDNCPTCQQKIEEEFRTSKIKELKTTMLEKKDGVQILLEKIKEKKEEKRKIEIHNKSVLENKKNHSVLNYEIDALKNKLNGNQKTIEFLSKPRSTETSKIEQTEKEIEQIKKDLIYLEEQLNYHQFETEIQKNCSILLKDSGIKATIMSKYLKLLNQHMDNYLKQFGLKLDFVLDSSFNERITNFSGHEFSYFSLSEGEKLRVDLAMMFSWRNIASMRAKMKTNLLILDEVMDGAADTVLQEELVEHLNSLEENNIFVISHRSAGLIDKFDRNLHVERKIGFSEIIENIL